MASQPRSNALSRAPTPPRAHTLQLLASTASTPDKQPRAARLALLGQQRAPRRRGVLLAVALKGEGGRRLARLAPALGARLAEEHALGGPQAAHGQALRVHPDAAGVALAQRLGPVAAAARDAEVE